MDKGSICVICRQTSKYKCPSCCVKYCSVTCYKTHKEQGCQLSTAAVINPCDGLPESDICEDSLEEGEVSDAEVEDTEDRVPTENLNNLENSQELKQMLKNPHLRDIMKNICISDNPSKLIEKAMQEPIFSECADECLRMIEDT